MDTGTRSFFRIPVHYILKHSKLPYIIQHCQMFSCYGIIREVEGVIFSRT